MGINSKKMDSLVESINSSDTMLRIFEVGAGMPVSSNIFQREHASKTIYSAESLYSRIAYDKKFGVSPLRAVCAERLQIINNDPNVLLDIKEGLYNTVYSSTFQLGGHGQSAHGWISLKTKKITKYYHVSIHQPMMREEYIKKIGEIGIKIILSMNESSFEDSYIDTVLDSELVPMGYETLEFLSNQIEYDNCSVFTVNGTIERMEYITRDYEKLIVYKGSFNPPTIAHIEIMKLTMGKYPTAKAVFCINADTYQKGHVSVDSLCERIDYLNTLGFDVVISNKPLFVDTIKLLRNKFGGGIVFPIGIDTSNRISEVYGDTRFMHIKNDFAGCNIIVYQRVGEIPTENTNIFFKEGIFIPGELPINDNLSSTIVREAIRTNNIKVLEKYLPNELKPLIIKQ